MAEAASGVCFFYEAMTSSVIIELRRMTGHDGYVLASMWGQGNCYVSKDVRADLAARFAGWGIPEWRNAPLPPEWVTLLDIGGRPYEDAEDNWTVA